MFGNDFAALLKSRKKEINKDETKDETKDTSEDIPKDEPKVESKPKKPVINLHEKSMLATSTADLIATVEKNDLLAEEDKKTLLTSLNSIKSKVEEVAENKDLESLRQEYDMNNNTFNLLLANIDIDHIKKESENISRIYIEEHTAQIDKLTRLCTEARELPSQADIPTLQTRIKILKLLTFIRKLPREKEQLEQLGLTIAPNEITRNIEKLVNLFDQDSYDWKTNRALGALKVEQEQQMQEIKLKRLTNQFEELQQSMKGIPDDIYVQQNDLFTQAEKLIGQFTQLMETLEIADYQETDDVTTFLRREISLSNNPRVELLPDKSADNPGARADDPARKTGALGGSAGNPGARADDPAKLAGPYQRQQLEPEKLSLLKKQLEDTALPKLREQQEQAQQRAADESSGADESKTESDNE